MAHPDTVDARTAFDAILPRAEVERGEGEKVFGRHGLTFPSLHGLRGLLALWVLLSHATSGRGFMQFPKYGYLAVDMFFVMSGFILMETHRGDFRKLSLMRTVRFLSLRFWRTIPIHVAIIIFTLLTSGLLFAYWPTAREFFSSLFFVSTWIIATTQRSANGTVWSLHVEWIGYLAFPLLCWMLLRIRSPLLVAALACGIILSETVVLLLTGNGELATTRNVGALARMAGGFSLGCLIWQLFQLPAFKRELRDGTMAIAIVAATTILLFAPAVFVLVPLAVIVASCVLPGPSTAAILESTFARFSGRISFSLYMVHFPVFRVAEFFQTKSTLPGALFSLGAMAASLACAVGICIAIEEPARRFGRKLTNTFIGPAAPRGS